MSFLDLLHQGFNDHVDLREKPPRRWKLIAPLFHEDGAAAVGFWLSTTFTVAGKIPGSAGCHANAEDRYMVDIFLEQRNGPVRVSDHGLSLMRLSYNCLSG